MCLYAPALKAATKVKDQFYAQLDSVIKSIPAYEHIFILRDFNARVGANSVTKEGLYAIECVPVQEELNTEHIKEELSKAIDAPACGEAPGEENIFQCEGGC